MSNIGTSDALDLLDSPELVLTSGYLRNFEQIALMSGYHLNATMTIPIDTSMITSTGLTASLAKSMLSGGIKNAHLTTNATLPCYTDTDMSKTSSQSIDLVPGDKIATDNYGLAIDFWIRTNAEKGYLILEGEIDKEEQSVREIGSDGDGNQVDLYSAVIVTPEGNTNADVYKKNNKYYLNGTNDEVTIVSGSTVQEKYKVVTSVYGYDGVNRVWDGNAAGSLLTVESTTQGNGSCYIFYADSPEEQTKFLKLLESFRVAFVSERGELLATAVMNVDEAFAVNGKVTVPLAIKDPLTEEKEVEDEETGETVIKSVPILDENNNPIYGITELERNKTIMITSIVYIDGTLLGNDDVLAASSIQGQLNLQFGSSTKLYPAGNLQLEAEKRVISASVDKTSFDFAVDDDISVDVTLTVDGDNPANISGFFQRAINATQGKRMPSENFVRQRGEGSTWTAHFEFNTPGEYYLREVMLDGVNYRLLEPIHVSVTGFAPEYVFWGEAEDDVTIYTASSKYIETVGISFGASGGVTQADSVRLKFEGSNGNYITTKLSYDYMQARWSGKAELGTSSTYVLKFVEVNGEDYDLSQYNVNFVKTLRLFLGLTARVETSSAQSDFFVPGETFAKDVRVEIYDNVGNSMPNLDDAVLTYSRGGSSTNTVTAPLEWDNSKGAYTGTLSITRAGSYKFYNIMIGENKITRALSSPTFTLKNPDPVKYVTSSASTYHGEDNIQFVPLTMNAYIGPIRINNSDTAYIEAVVVNSITNEEYSIVQTADSNKRGTIYYDAGSWYINLPTYRPDNGDGTYGDLTQDGTWTVKSISLWDVMDENNVEHEESNKLVWTDGVDGYDFSALSTTVSSTFNITMTPGNTSFGDSSTPFMTKHALASESGMYVTLKDNTGRVIPKSVIKDITLNLTYTGNTDMSYGYKVSSEYRPSLYVRFSELDESTGNWTASVDPKIQYVGVYTVKNLVVAMTNMTQTIEPGKNGVPESYTVTSQGPESNVKYEVRVGDNSSLGKTNGTVTGTFLQPQTPDIRVITRVTYEDEQGLEQTAQYAIIENFGVQLIFSYKNGNTAPNGGGYTWSASNLTSITMDMTKSETTTNGEVYRAGSNAFLAGSYSVSGNILLNGRTVPINYAFPDISVYSIKPTVKVSGVSPDPSTDITIYQQNNPGNAYANYKWENGTKVSVKNAYRDYFANLYMSAAENQDESYGLSADFTAPTLSLSLSAILST
ncbi:MAG: hypothetical protein IJT91_07830 [Clostridia bacterium]|nr:hypothetical protein [Clostridia bacterium]